MELRGRALTSAPARPARRGAIALVSVLVLAALGFWGPTAPAADGAACGTSFPSDADFYRAMVDARDDGWLGGDAPGHVDLGGGRMLWLYGDSTWGEREPSGRYAAGWEFVTNSAGEQRGQCITHHRAFRDFVTPSAGADLYWPKDGWVSGDDVYVVFTRIRRTGGGTVFSFRTDGQDLVRLDRDTLTVENRERLPDPDRDWGSSVELVGTTLYWWGRSFTRDTGDFHLARSSVLLPGVFEYRTKDGWSLDPDRAVPVHRRNQTSNATFHRLPDGRWAAVYKDHELFGTGVVADVAANPWGPFAHMGRIASAVPRTRRTGEFTYAATIIPSIGWDEGRLLVQWSHNALDFGRVIDGTVRYQPDFVTVPTSTLAKPEAYAQLTRQRNFAVAAHRSFTGAKPSGAIADHWANELNFGVPRRTLSGALARSDAWIGRQVDAIHRAGYGRDADPATRSRWADAIRGGARLGDVAAEVFGSAEFSVRAGRTDRGFVAGVYSGVLGRRASSAEIDAWSRRLAAGTSRADVVRAIHASSESRGRRVRVLYHDLLGRPVDRAGLDWGIARLSRGDDLALAADIAASAEYLQRAQRTADADR